MLPSTTIDVSFLLLKMKTDFIPELPFFHFPVCPDVVVAYDQECLEIQATVEDIYVIELV